MQTKPATLSGRLNAFCDHLIHQEECRGFVPEVERLEKLAELIGPAFPGFNYLVKIAENGQGLPPGIADKWREWGEKVEKLVRGNRLT